MVELDESKLFIDLEKTEFKNSTDEMMAMLTNNIGKLIVLFKDEHEFNNTQHYEIVQLVKGCAEAFVKQDKEIKELKEKIKILEEQIN